MAYNKLYAAFTSRTNDFEKFCEMLDSFPNDDRKFDRVFSCLSVGTGTGKWEIEFIKRFMPNLKSFTAIEADALSVAELRANLERELPTLEVEVHQATVEEVLLGTNSNTLKSHDAVLLFQILYHLDEENRAALYKTIFDKVLRSGGQVIINHVSSSNNPNDIDLLITRLNPGLVTPVTQLIKQEIVRSGFKHDREENYSIEVDFSNPDDDLLEFVTNNMTFTPTLSMGDFRAAVQRVYDSKIASISFTLCVFEKP